jgi:membrane-bound lytic murein transglycosylase F
MMMVLSANLILKKSMKKLLLNNFEQTKFKDLLANRFPKYREMFEQASTKTTIDSDLLAAISFQESQWDPRAKSNMGVRGNDDGYSRDGCYCWG